MSRKITLHPAPYPCCSLPCVLMDERRKRGRDILLSSAGGPPSIGHAWAGDRRRGKMLFKETHWHTHTLAHSSQLSHPSYSVLLWRCLPQSFCLSVFRGRTPLVPLGVLFCVISTEKIKWSGKHIIVFSLLLLLWCFLNNFFFTIFITYF